MAIADKFAFWDVALLLAVPAQATMMAYIHPPRWKALLLTIPLPFTLATLAVGRGVTTDNLIGVVLLTGFAHAVRALHVKARLPIIPAIAAGAGMYCAAGAILVPRVPDDDRTFFITAAAVLAFGVVALILTPFRAEPGHRSPLPVYLKFPIIAAVIAGLVMAKSLLEGFVATFPMVGVVTAYEARHSLWTIARQMPICVIVFVPMITAIRLSQDALGVGSALLVGWAVMFAVLIPLTTIMWRAEHAHRTP